MQKFVLYGPIAVRRLDFSEDDDMGMKLGIQLPGNPVLDTGCQHMVGIDIAGLLSPVFPPDHTFVFHPLQDLLHGSVMGLDKVPLERRIQSGQRNGFGWGKR